MHMLCFCTVIYTYICCAFAQLMYTCICCAFAQLIYTCICYAFAQLIYTCICYAFAQLIYLACSSVTRSLNKISNLYTYIHMCIILTLYALCAYIHTQSITHSFIQRQTHIRTYIHTYIHIHTYIYIHTYRGQRQPEAISNFVAD